MYICVYECMSMFLLVTHVNTSVSFVNVWHCTVKRIFIAIYFLEKLQNY